MKKSYPIYFIFQRIACLLKITFSGTVLCAIFQTTRDLWNHLHSRDPHFKHGLRTPWLLSSPVTHSECHIPRNGGACGPHGRHTYCHKLHVIDSRLSPSEARYRTGHPAKGLKPRDRPPTRHTARIYRDVLTIISDQYETQSLTVFATVKILHKYLRVKI